MSFAEVRIPLLQAGPLPALRVEVRQALNRHELAIVKLRNTDGLARRIRRGSPVRIVFGNGRVTDTFLGYVEAVQTDHRGQSITVPALEVTCIGASNVLLARRHRVWRGSYSLIAQDMARLGMLKATVQPTKGSVLINQRGQTDWEFLQEMARLTGRVVYCHGVQLNFVRKGFWLSTQGRNAPRLTLGASVGLPGAIVSFRPRLAVLDPDAPLGLFSINVVGGGTVNGTGTVLDPARSELPVAKHAYPVFGTARTQVEAADRVAGLEELARYTHRAQVMAMGDARATAGRPVYLVGVPSDLTGYWVVGEVRHIVTPDNYTMDLDLHSDSTGGPVMPPPLVHAVLPDPGDVPDSATGDAPDLETDAPSLEDEYTPDAPDQVDLTDGDYAGTDPETAPADFGDEALLDAIDADTDPDAPVPQPIDDDFSWAAT